MSADLGGRPNSAPTMGNGITTAHLQTLTVYGPTGLESDPSFTDPAESPTAVANEG